MDRHHIQKLLQQPQALIGHIEKILGDYGLQNGQDNIETITLENSSAVLFVLSPCSSDDGAPCEPCLILNKRSQQVKQPGDLCCPGGGISMRLDRILASLLRYPGSPLQRWLPWSRWKREHPSRSKALALLLAASLREAWEEMRLNPLRVSFLGFLPAQRLVMFDRVIYPMVGWAADLQRLKPNWEVERIVPIPLRRLLNLQYYGRFRPMMTPKNSNNSQPLRRQDFPCFTHQEEDQGRELLWGATYRITQDFLKLVFRFSAPESVALPVVNGHLDAAYLNGSRYDAN